MKVLIAISLLLLVGVGLIAVGSAYSNQEASQAGIGFAISGLIGVIIRKVGQ